MPLLTGDELLNWVRPATGSVVTSIDVATAIRRAGTGKVINEEGPMLPQNVRDELLEIAEEAFGRIRAGIQLKERKIIRSFDRSSYREWELSPHRELANSLEYLYGQISDLRALIQQGSMVGIRILSRVLRQNWTYSFQLVDEELKEPKYNYRNEGQKARARQYYKNAWRARQPKRGSGA